MAVNLDPRGLCDTQCLNDMNKKCLLCSDYIMSLVPHASRIQFIIVCANGVCRKLVTLLKSTNLQYMLTEAVTPPLCTFPAVAIFSRALSVDPPLLHRLTSLYWREISMKFSADVHRSQRMKYYDFSDPLTFQPAPTAGQSFQ